MLEQGEEGGAEAGGEQACRESRKRGRWAANSCILARRLWERLTSVQEERRGSSRGVIKKSRSGGRAATSSLWRLLKMKN